MPNLVDPLFWSQVFSITFSDLLLAGDNALVIALAVRTLPRKAQWWGRVWGTLGAVTLRLIFITIVTYLLQFPLLQMVGGLMLIWIALKLVRQESGAEEHVRQGTTLMEAVSIIILADVVMSLDNVLAIAVVAEGHLGLVIFGIALSMPIVVFGSALLAALMNKFTWIIWVGGGVLGYYAGKLICEDPVVRRVLGDYAEVCAESVPLILGAGIAAIGWGFEQGRKRRARKHAHHHRAA
jgi:YjbE family integral membrane protein